MELKLAKGAFEAAAEGDVEKHNKAIFETASSFSDKEAIVLSQMSQIRALPLFEEFPIPVLSSPPVSLGLLVDEIEKRQNS